MGLKIKSGLYPIGRTDILLGKGGRIMLDPGKGLGAQGEIDGQVIQEPRQTLAKGGMGAIERQAKFLARTDVAPNQRGPVRCPLRVGYFPAEAGKA